MFRSNLIKKGGNYPKNFKYAQDYAFYLKILKISKIKFINKSLVKLRIPHQHSETFRNTSSKIMTLELLKILVLNLMNFKTSFFEKLSIFSVILFNLIKFFPPSFFINLKKVNLQSIKLVGGMKQFIKVFSKRFKDLNGTLAQ